MPSILETTREVNKDWNPIHESWLPSTMTTQFLQGDPSKPIRSNGDQVHLSPASTPASHAREAAAARLALQPPPVVNCRQWRRSVCVTRESRNATMGCRCPTQEAFSGVATGRSVGHKKQQTQSLDARLGTGRRDEFPMPEGIHTRASISGGDAYRVSGGDGSFQQLAAVGSSRGLLTQTSAFDLFERRCCAKQACVLMDGGNNTPLHRKSA